MSLLNTLICPQGTFWNYINVFASWSSDITAGRYCGAAAAATAGSQRMETKRKKLEVRKEPA